MPKYILVIACIFICAFSPHGELPAVRTHDAESPKADSLFGVFEGRTPCGDIAPQFTGFLSRNCEKIKWRLTLYHNPANGKPTTYAFKGTRSTRHGTWKIVRSALPNKSLVIYQLYYGHQSQVLSLLTLDDKVLVLLDHDLNILAGDASWSYVLNRTNQQTQ